MKTKIWIDNGHGVDTPGKHSPDMRLREYAWNREVAGRLVRLLVASGYDAELLVPELHDVPIKTRAQRVNRTCYERGKDHVLLVSVHVNAAANGGWHDADFWTCWIWKKEWKDANGKTYKVAEASRESKELCREMYLSAQMEGFKTSGFPAWEANFGILRETLCPAVLVENFFQDNRKNVDWLLSEKGKEACIRVMFIGIENYIDKHEGIKLA